MARQQVPVESVTNTETLDSINSNIRTLLLFEFEFGFELCNAQGRRQRNVRNLKMAGVLRASTKVAQKLCNPSAVSLHILIKTWNIVENYFV